MLLQTNKTKPPPPPIMNGVFKYNIGIGKKNMKEIELQLLVALAMLITTLIAGFAPLKLLTVMTSSGEPSRKVACILSLLSCFAGGIFLATCFLDVIPHVHANFHMFNVNSSLNTSYPLPEFLFCLGFFAVYLLEEVCVQFCGDKSHGHSHGINEEQRSLNKIVVDECDGDVINNNNNNNNNNAKQQSKLYRNDMVVVDNIITYGQLRKMSSIAESLNKAEIGALQSITFAIAMSFHSVLEGLALGVQDTKMAIMTLFISLMLHKGIEAFSVGLQISKSNTQRIKIAAITIFVYSLMTPIGSLIGIYIQNADIEPVVKEGLIVFLESLAVGTFIYVTFFEVLAAEKANEFSNIVQLVAIFAGFIVIALFQVGQLLITGSH